MSNKKVNATTTFAVGQEIGGVNLLVPFAKQLSPNFKLCLDSPSKELYEESVIISIKEVIESSNPGDRILVAGSIDNLSTQTLPLYEHCKKNEIDFSITLDNWVYYPERLKGLGQTNLIVFDSFAFKYAKSVFGSTHKIYQVENSFANAILIESERVPKNQNSWLFLDSRPNTFTDFPTDIHALGCCCSQIVRVMKFSDHVTYRSHPSYKRLECLSYLASFPSSKIIFSEESNLAKDLGRHSHIFGSPGYALYLGLLAGKQVFVTSKTTPTWHGPEFTLLSSFSF